MKMKDPQLYITFAITGVYISIAIFFLTISVCWVIDTFKERKGRGK